MSGFQEGSSRRRKSLLSAFMLLLSAFACALTRSIDWSRRGCARFHRGSLSLCSPFGIEIRHLRDLGSFEPGFLQASQSECLFCVYFRSSVEGSYLWGFMITVLFSNRG